MVVKKPICSEHVIWLVAESREADSTRRVWRKKAVDSTTIVFDYASFSLCGRELTRKVNKLGTPVLSLYASQPEVHLRSLLSEYAEMFRAGTYERTSCAPLFEGESGSEVFQGKAVIICNVMEADGGIQICGDFKGTLNQACCTERCPVPVINKLFGSLERSIVYAVPRISSVLITRYHWMRNPEC